MVEQPVCVVLVVDDLGYGGTERQVVELANNLDRDRFDVHICTLSCVVPLAELLTDAERRLHVIRRMNRWDFTVVLRLARLLKTLRADIVHGFLFSAEIASRLAGRLAHTPLVLGSERNADHAVTAGHIVAHKLTARFVDAIIANSHAGAEWNRKVFRRSASDYRVVHNGVDTERFHPGSGLVTRGELGIPPQCPVVGVFANLKRQKNHAFLFRAFRRVLDALPEARLLIVGNQPPDTRGRLDGYVQQLQDLIDDLRIRHRCMFLGHQSTMETLYLACDLTVLPSLHEGTPNVVLESMACGVPVIATNVCDNKYLVEDGEVGYLVEVGDEVRLAHCIQSLLADTSLRQEMGKKARQWVLEEFSSRQFAEKMEDVYLEYLAKCRNQASRLVS